MENNINNPESSENIENPLFQTGTEAAQPSVESPFDTPASPVEQPEVEVAESSSGTPIEATETVVPVGDTQVTVTKVEGTALEQISEADKLTFLANTSPTSEAAPVSQSPEAVTQPVDTAEATVVSPALVEKRQSLGVKIASLIGLRH